MPLDFRLYQLYSLIHFIFESNEDTLRRYKWRGLDYHHNSDLKLLYWFVLFIMSRIVLTVGIILYSYKHITDRVIQEHCIKNGMTKAVHLITKSPFC